MSKFNVGTEVVQRRQSGMYGKIVKVAKVYKNGNFTITGSTQQFRFPGITGTTASATGTSFDSVELVTDENRPVIEKHHAFARSRFIIKAEIDRLNALMGLTFNNPKRDDVIAEAERIENTADIVGAFVAFAKEANWGASALTADTIGATNVALSQIERLWK